MDKADTNEGKQNKVSLETGGWRHQGSAEAKDLQPYVSASERVKLAKRGQVRIEEKTSKPRNKKPRRNRIDEFTESSSLYKKQKSSPVKTRKKDELRELQSLHPALGVGLEKTQEQEVQSMIDGNNFDELLDADEDNSLLKPDRELKYSKPFLNPPLLVHLAVLSMGEPEKYDVEEVEAFITTFFPYYRRRLKEWRKFTALFNFNPNIRLI